MSDTEWSEVLVLCPSCAKKKGARPLRDAPERDALSVSLCYDGCQVETGTSYFAPPHWPTAWPPSEAKKPPSRMNFGMR